MTGDSKREERRGSGALTRQGMTMTFAGETAKEEEEGAGERRGLAGVGCLWREGERGLEEARLPRRGGEGPRNSEKERRQNAEGALEGGGRGRDGKGQEAPGRQDRTRGPEGRGECAGRGMREGAGVPGEVKGWGRAGGQRWAGGRPPSLEGRRGARRGPPRTLPSRQQILQSPEWVRPPGSFFSEEPPAPRWGGASSLAVRLVVLQIKARAYSQ